MRRKEDQGQGRRGRDLPDVHNIIHMITQGNKQIKEKLPTHLHLHLHGAAALKGAPTANDEREVVGAEARVRVRRVLVGVTRTAQDGGDLDGALQALLAQCQVLELREAVLIRRAVHDRVFEQWGSHAGEVDSGFDAAATTRVLFGRGRETRVLKFPGATSLVVQQARVVVTLLWPGRLLSVAGVLWGAEC